MSGVGSSYIAAVETSNLLKYSKKDFTRETIEAESLADILNEVGLINAAISGGWTVNNATDLAEIIMQLFKIGKKNTSASTNEGIHELMSGIALLLVPANGKSITPKLKVVFSLHDIDDSTKELDPNLVEYLLQSTFDAAKKILKALFTLNTQQSHTYDNNSSQYDARDRRMQILYEIARSDSVRFLVLQIFAEANAVSADGSSSERRTGITVDDIIKYFEAHEDAFHYSNVFNIQKKYTKQKTDPEDSNNASPVAGTIDNSLGLQTRAKLRSKSLTLAMQPVEIKHSIPFPTVEVSNKTQAITSRYYVCVHQDRIWIKTRPKSDGGLEDSGTAHFPDWTLLPPYQGLPKLSPKDEKDPRYAEPSKIVEISADGWNLVAIADNGRAYYFKFLQDNGEKFQWQGKWGKPFAKWITLPKDARSWAIAHRHKDAEYFEDIDGNKHYGNAGVTSCYILSHDGNKISYIDPWIPPTFYNYRHPLPRRNKFVAEHFASGGSTCFVINRAGAMYTRLMDYDVSGENPLITYSYQRGKHDNKIDHGLFDWLRAQLGRFYEEVKEVVNLPPADWKEQPRIPDGCKLDPRTLTVIQTGKGNASRELRVEGIDAHGTNGYFVKMVDDDRWQFRAYTDSYRKTAKIHVVDFVEEHQHHELPPSRHLYDRPCLLEYRREHDDDNCNRRVLLRLKDFNPWVMHCTVQIFVLRDDIEEYKYEFTLHMRRARIVASEYSTDLLSTLIYDQKRIELPDPWGDHSDLCIKYRGMLSIPKENFSEGCHGCDILCDLFNGLKKTRSNAEISYEKAKLDQTHVLIPVSVFYDSGKRTVKIHEKFITKWPQAYLELPLAVDLIRHPIKWHFTEEIKHGAC